MEATLHSPFGQTVLESGVVTIGSTSDCRLVLHDPKVSPHHAVLRSTEQGYTITDWGSTEGTFVNEQRLEPMIPRLLMVGDLIRIGETVFTFEMHEGATLLAGQGSSPADEPGVLTTPVEHTAYGAGVQPSTAPPEQTAYGSLPQQEYPPATPQQPDMLPGASGASTTYEVAPPPQPPYTPPVQQKKPGGGWLRIALIAVAALIVLGGIGTGAFLLTRPQPVISVTSDYKVGSTPAGATGTVFHVSGQKFSANSNVTFLLDGTPVSSARIVESDANGNLKTNLTVTAEWAVGDHTLTAKDAGNYVTKAGVALVIVPQGQAHTPGPNGAPPNDASFAIQATIKAQDTVTGKQLNDRNETLTITGRPDPAGGSVSISYRDDGQPQTYSGDFGNGLTYTEKIIFKGSGTYRGGKLSYTETIISDQYTLSNGATCKLNTPYVVEHLEGTFSDQDTISGTYSADAYSIPCSDGGDVYGNALTGSWSGTLEQSGAIPISTFPVLKEALWAKPLA